MLMLTRREGETIQIRLSSHVDPSTPVSEIAGTIGIAFIQLSGNRIKLGIEAGREWHILRGELIEAARLQKATD